MFWGCCWGGWVGVREGWLCSFLLFIKNEMLDVSGNTCGLANHACMAVIETHYLTRFVSSQALSM